MYIPKLYRQEDRATILEFLRQNEFATVVSHDGDRPIASHLLLEVQDRGERLVVNGHMSKANPLWKTFEREGDILLIFQGPHAYISPTWYNHVNVPTWNYQAIHLYGRPRLVTQPEELHTMLARIVARHEGPSNYRLAGLPADFVASQMKGIVAFQIEVSQIEASYKLSQNRDDQDYHNIITQLNERPDDLSQAVAEAMARQRPGPVPEQSA